MPAVDDKRIVLDITANYLYPRWPFYIANSIQLQTIIQPDQN